MRILLTWFWIALLSASALGEPVSPGAKPAKPRPVAPPTTRSTPPYRPRLSPAQSTAQKPLNHIGGGLGIAFEQTTEGLTLPLRHEGFNPSFEIRFDRETSLSQLANLQYRIATLSDRLGETSRSASFNVAYAVAFSVSTSVDLPIGIWIGPMARYRSDIAFYPSLDDAHRYWFTAADLRALVRATYKPAKRHSFSVSFDLPAVGTVSRPPLNRFTTRESPDTGDILARANEDLVLATWTTYQSFAAIAEYDFDAADQIRQSLRYQFLVDRFEDPRRYQSLTHSLMVDMAWGW